MCKWIHMGCPCCYVREVPEQEARDICHRCKASNFQNAQARAGQSVTAIMGVTRGVKRIWRGTQEVSHTQTCHHCGAWFLKHSTVHIFSWIICVGCPIHCETFSTISGLYPLDAISNPLPNCDNQNVPTHCQVLLGGQNHPWLKATAPGINESWLARSLIARFRSSVPCPKYYVRYSEKTCGSSKSSLPNRMAKIVSRVLSDYLLPGWLWCQSGWSGVKQAEGFKLWLFYLWGTLAASLEGT